MVRSEGGADSVRVILDPTSERSLPIRARLPRPAKLEGLKIGLLDIAKARGDVLLDRLEELFTERGAVIRRYKKPTFTKPAPIDVRSRIAEECAAVVEALAD
jgi:hypothetical protein